MSGLPEDIRSLNRHCLLVLRDIAKSDCTNAAYLFGCSVDLARKISGMSLDDLHRMSVSSNMLFALKIQPSTVQPIVNAPDYLRSALIEGQKHAAT